VAEKNQLSRRKSALPHQQKVNFFLPHQQKKAEHGKSKFVNIARK
jgi:hypothetical protein